MGNQNVVCVSNGIWVNNEKEWTTNKYYNMDEPQKRFTKWKKPNLKESILYDSVLLNVKTRQSYRDRKHINVCEWMELGVRK